MFKSFVLGLFLSLSLLVSPTYAQDNSDIQLEQGQLLCMTPATFKEKFVVPGGYGVIAASVFKEENLLIMFLGNKDNSAIFAGHFINTDKLCIMSIMNDVSSKFDFKTIDPMYSKDGKVFEAKPSN
jgi:hypothetical protein